IPDEWMDDKPHSLTVYGVGPQGFTPLATSPRDFQLKSARPIGSVDGLDADGNVTGWALVPSMTPASIDIDLYLDDPSGGGTKLATAHAARPRADVNQTTGYDGDHGFSFAVPDDVRDELDHTLYAFVTGPRAVAAVGSAAFNLPRVFHARKG